MQYEMSANKKMTNIGQELAKLQLPAAEGGLPPLSSSQMDKLGYLLDDLLSMSTAEKRSVADERVAYLLQLGWLMKRHYHEGRRSALRSVIFNRDAEWWQRRRAFELLF